jgi:hypothetical protein
MAHLVSVVGVGQWIGSVRLTVGGRQAQPLAVNAPPPIHAAQRARFDIAGKLQGEVEFSLQQGDAILTLDGENAGKPDLLGDVIGRPCLSDLRLQTQCPLLQETDDVGRWERGEERKRRFEGGVLLDRSRNQVREPVMGLYPASVGQFINGALR